MEWFAHGFDATDLVLAFNRATLGAFFVLARFRWFYDPSRYPHCWWNCGRHDHLVQRLCTCGYSSHPYLAGAVATVEVSAGMALIIGLLSPLAALGLLTILIGATYCTAKEKVMKQGPVDKIDCASCYLWTVEPLYMIMALIVILAGPGRWSLDWWLFR